MKNIIFYISILFLLTQCDKSKKSLDYIINAEYDKHFISSGNNFPQISLTENDRFKFLIGLHNGYSKDEMKIILNWSDTLLMEEIELLIDNGYLKQENQHVFPSISIIMQDEGKHIFKHVENIAEEIVISIIEVEPEINKIYSKMSISNSHLYSEMSFFLLSDVLLDNWQINNVESDFLIKERTLRHGKRYYIQFAEKDTLYNKEVFGIYGNQYTCQDTICFITYGNNRVNNAKTFEEMLTLEIPFLTNNDQLILREMAAFYKPKLIEILETNRPNFVKEYENSVYINEISFEEYFIWYYHFLYTSVTDKLAEKELLIIPKNGIFRIQLEQ